jgi:two-component system response regulator AtoC
MQTCRVLVGEDELEVRGYLQMAFRCLGYTAEFAQDGDEVLSYLRSSRKEIDAVLLDLMMPNRDGFETLCEIRKFDTELPVIVLSGAASTLNVVNAMKSGATDFLCKPVSYEDLQKSIARALERSGTPYVPVSRPTAPVTGLFMGHNPRMREIQTIIGQVGWSEAPVLIQGETGTGKEMLARELHARSPRAGKPFLKLNCAALPSELVESELFGYERGAFTGAFQKKAGMFENADGGTLLLDEIGDMDVRLQAKLLQVLQDSSFQRIGGKEVIRVDVRIMAATHRDLEEAILERNFREDLYYRLNVINLHLPRLNDRKEDIVPLAEHLIKKHSAKNSPIPLTVELKQALVNYHWPGNVRELENYVRKLLIFRDCAAITRELQSKVNRMVSAVAPLRHRVSHPAPVSLEVEESPILEQVVKAKQQAETDAILAALTSTRWNRKKAAGILKIDYKALLYKMKKLGIEVKPVSSANAAHTSQAVGM